MIANRFFEDVVKFPMQRGAAKRIMNGIFDRFDSVKKPSDVHDANGAEMPALSPEEANAVASLPIIKRDASADFLDQIDSGGEQYYVLQHGKDAFLVDTQGYDYPRYVLRMPSVKARSLGDIKGAKSGDKDVQRIVDMKVKSGGNEGKLLQFAANMAKAINSKSKAERRADAALKVLDGPIAKKVAQIFLDSAKKAVNENRWLGIYQ